MDWVKGVQQAIDYVETHITEELKTEEIAAESFSSPYHFQRVFSILCGYTLGEYIRFRRLTLAGKELQETPEKVIDVALKYGYDSPDSFARAFARFHGITPTQARKKGAVLQAFSPLSVKIILEGGEKMKYRLEDRGAMVFIGHGYVCGGEADRMQGAENGGPEEKIRDTTKHWMSSRREQDILRAIRPEENVWYDIYTDFTEEGFTHYIGVRKPDKWNQQGACVLYGAEIGERDENGVCEPCGTGIGERDENSVSVPRGAGIGEEGSDVVSAHTGIFREIRVPAGKYVIVESERKESPEEDYLELQRQIISQWLPASGYVLADRPQINRVVMDPEPGKRYMEIWMPVE